jgi:hypothetical protein
LCGCGIENGKKQKQTARVKDTTWSQKKLDRRNPERKIESEHRRKRSEDRPLGKAGNAQRCCAATKAKGTYKAGRTEYETTD